MPTPDLRLTDLLSERAWVERLARSLVRDEALADDLAQETWLAALERPPTWERSPRGWLGRVLRNRLARHGRRGARAQRRERAAARPEALPAADDVLGAAEQHKRVVDALWTLDEVHRTAVLLRWYEGLPPREIAARTGAPVETVRSRVRRGVEQMRARLDAEHGGRRAWVTALTPLLAGVSPAPAGAPLGAAAAAVLLLGGAVGLWWGLRTPSSTGPEAPDRVPAGASSGPALRGRERADRPPGAGDAADAPDARTPRVPPYAPGGVRVRLRGTTQAPPGPVTVAVGGFGASRYLYVARAPADDGWVPLDGVPSHARVPILWAQAPGTRLVRRTDVEIASGTTVIELEPAAPQRLAFVDEGGATLAPADVRARFAAAGVEPGAEWIWPEAWAPSSAADVLRSVVGGLDAWRIGASALTWSDDGASVGDGLPVPGARLLVRRPSGVAWLSPPLAEGDLLRVPLAARPLRLRLLDAATGAALAGARATPFTEHGDDALFLRGTARTADARGELLLEVPADEPRRRAPSLLIEAWAEGGADQGASPTHVLWLTQGLSSRLGRGRAADATGTVELRVPPAATLVGRAFAADGAPAAGRDVVWLERGLVRSARVERDGAFRLEGVAPWRAGDDLAAARAVSVVLLDPGTGAPGAAGGAQVRPGATVEVQVGRPAGARDRGDLRGRVRAGGRPLEGLLLMARRRGADDDGERLVAASGADGVFAFHALLPGTYDLVALLGNPRVSDDHVLRRGAPVLLEGGGEVEVALALPGGRLAVRVVDDATGAPLPGAMLRAHPERPEASAGAVEGWSGVVGSSAFADEAGRALLGALLPGEPHLVEAYAEGYREARRTGALPAADRGPEPGPELELRLQRR